MGFRKEVLRNLALLTQLGLSVVIPVFLCIFIGLELEKRFNINITLILLILGILAGCRNAWLLVKKAGTVTDRKNYEDYNEDKEDKDGFEDEEDDI